MSTEAIDEEKLAAFAMWVRKAVRPNQFSASQYAEARALWATMTQAEKNEAERRSEVAACGIKGSN